MTRSCSTSCKGCQTAKITQDQDVWLWICVPRIVRAYQDFIAICFELFDTDILLVRAFFIFKKFKYMSRGKLKPFFYFY